MCLQLWAQMPKNSSEVCNYAESDTLGISESLHSASRVSEARVPPQTAPCCGGTAHGQRGKAWSPDAHEGTIVADVRQPFRSGSYCKGPGRSPGVRILQGAPEADSAARVHTCDSLAGMEVDCMAWPMNMQDPAASNLVSDHESAAHIHSIILCMCLPQQ